MPTNTAEHIRDCAVEAYEVAHARYRNAIKHGTPDQMAAALDAWDAAFERRRVAERDCRQGAFGLQLAVARYTEAL